MKEYNELAKDINVDNFKIQRYFWIFVVKLAKFEKIVYCKQSGGIVYEKLVR